MNLNRRYSPWMTDHPSIWQQCEWWSFEAITPLLGIGILVNHFNDDLRHATMLEF